MEREALRRAGRRLTAAHHQPGLHCAFVLGGVGLRWGDPVGSALTVSMESFVNHPVSKCCKETVLELTIADDS